MGTEIFLKRDVLKKMDLRSLFRVSPIVSVYFAVAFAFSDIWMKYVIGGSASNYTYEMLRLVGISSIVIISVHSLIAANYMDVMKKRAAFIQGCYYALCALTMWRLLPLNFMGVVHVGTLGGLAAALLAFSYKK